MNDYSNCSYKKELEGREPTIKYTCKNCQHTKFNGRQLRSIRDGFTAIFDIQTGLYRSISCQGCKHVELYEGKISNSLLVLDTLFG